MNIIMLTCQNKFTTILLLAVYRIAAALLVRNYQYPDQYWQGNQIAHYCRYGYGYRTWEWTISQPIRNPLYPYLLSLSYSLLDILNIPSVHAYAPRFLIQVPLSIVTDYYLLKLLKLLYGSYTNLMLLSVFGNWYYASTMVRTYFNSFQTMAAVIGVYYWVGSGGIGGGGWKDWKCRVVAIVSYVARPTSVMIWAILWPYQLIQIARRCGPFTKNSLNYLLKNLLTITIMISISFLVGSLYNNRPTLTQLNFIKYNFIEKWSQLYGKEPWYFYFFISVPFVVNTGLVFVAAGLWHIGGSYVKGRKGKEENQQSKNEKKTVDNVGVLVMLCIVYLCISSLSVHKQHRFIFPIIPFILIISAYPLSPTSNSPKKYPTLLPLLSTLTLILNLCLFLQFNFYGKSDGITAWNYINEVMTTHNMPANSTKIIVMGQSHFMPPAYSMLHKEVLYRVPDCSAEKMARSLDQVRLLWENPEGLFRKLGEGEGGEPDFVIAQGKYLQYTAHVMAEREYRQTRHWRHCTLFQEAYFGYDSISIFEKARKDKKS